MGRIYVLFTIGLVTRAVGLRPEKINITGIELAIENPDAVPGALFAVCLALYLGLLAQLTIHGVNVGYGRFTLLRSVYLEAFFNSRKGTLRRLTPRQRHGIKNGARAIYCANRFSIYAYRFAPLLYIVIRELPSVWKALTGLI